MNPLVPATTTSRSGLQTPAPHPRDEGKIRDAAREFEALLIQQMLRSARESESTGGLGSEDHANDSIRDYAEQQIAQVLSASGGFGLASLVTQGLKATPSPSKPSSRF